VAETLELLRRLTDAGVEFVVIGGVAAVAYGSPVTTDDVDLCAPMAKENVVKILVALADVEPRWRMRPDLPVVKPDDSYLGQLKNVYLRTRLGPLDVLGEIPGVCGYEEAAAKAVVMDFDGVACKVIDMETLIAAKRVAGRPHDLRTIEFLEHIKRQG
jgi:predicted nucleotidyltransferase